MGAGPAMRVGISGKAESTRFKRTLDPAPRAYVPGMPRTRTVVLDHIGVNVRDLRKARRFYEAALGAIGMINMDVRSAFGMGSRSEKIFWLARDAKAVGGGHYALRVDHREEVDAFHAAALAAGGTDNGRPGPRPHYGPSYYAAFVRDPEQNNIEVVCYAPPRRRRAARK